MQSLAYYQSREDYLRFLVANPDWFDMDPDQGASSYSDDAYLPADSQGYQHEVDASFAYQDPNQAYGMPSAGQYNPPLDDQSTLYYSSQGQSFATDPGYDANHPSSSA